MLDFDSENTVEFVKSSDNFEYSLEQKTIVTNALAQIE